MRLRLTAEQVEPTVAEVRAVLRERGRTAATWEVGTSATPDDLADRLAALGMVADEDPVSVAMVLVDEPPPCPPEIETRPVETLEEYRTANEIIWEGFGTPEEHRREARRTLERRWVERDPTWSQEFLAVLEGEPVAAGNAIYGPGAVMLYSGTTLPHARGRGAYRALVRARWDSGVARRAPALITQAGRMSRPILGRLGFREVAENRIFLDRDI